MKKWFPDITKWVLLSIFPGFLVKTATFLGFGLFNGTLWRWQNYRPVFQMQPAFWRKIGTVAPHFVAGIRAVSQLLSGVSLHSYRYAWASPPKSWDALRLKGVPTRG